MTQRLGFADPRLFAVMLVLAEVLGGVLLILGLFTRLAAAAVLFEFCVAIGKVHWLGTVEKSLPDAGFNLAMMMWVGAFVLLLTGGGLISVWPGRFRK